MPLINCKIYLELNWIEDCILSSAGDSSKFKTIDAKWHVPIVTLSTKDNVNLIKQLSDGFKRSVDWSSYQITPAKVTEKGKKMYELLSASFGGVKRLFVLAYFIAEDAYNNEAGIKNNRNYFLPIGENKNYNVFIEGINHYDQPIDHLIKQYDEI